MNTTTEIVSRATVDQIVVVYEDACRKVQDGYRLLEEAEKQLNSVLGERYFEFATIDHYDHKKGKAAADHIKSKLKKNVWKGLIDRLGLRKILSVKRAEEFDKKFNDKREWDNDPDIFPEITTINVFDLFQSLMGSSNDFAKEAVMEVYQFLHPHVAAWNKQYKTNEKNAKFDLGEKVILVWWVEGSYSRSSPFRVPYGHEAEFVALDRVFHLLDGAGIPKGYKSPLVDAINMSPTGTGETEYFKFKCYRNRNLHLTFKRMDLVQELNQIANDGTRLKDGKKR